MGMGGQRHAPAALPQGMTRYQLYRRLGRPQGAENLAPTGIFFSSCPVFSFDPFCTLNPSVLHVTLCSILLSLYNKHNTNINAPDGIRTHNPSKRTAVDPRLKPRGHWDRQIRSPDRPARSESLYRLRYPGPPLNYKTI